MLPFDPTTLTPPIEQGGKPLSDAQLRTLMKDRLELLWPSEDRQILQVTDPAAYATGAQAIIAIKAQIEAINLFNRQLADYRAAVARLARYRLADGRAAWTEQVETGEMVWNETTQTMEPVLQTIEHPAIEPVPATIDSVDEAGNQITILNPVVVKDDAERAAAQAVIDATPAEVVTYDQASQA